MRTFVWLLVSVSLTLGSRAVAIDLTGTWVSTRGGAAKCREFSGTWKPVGNAVLGTLYIKQVTLDLYVEIGVGGFPEFDNKFKGMVLPAAGAPEKGAGSATACTIDGKLYSGVFLISKAHADATRGSMTVEFVGLDNSLPARCKAKFERMDAADPGVAASCP